MLLTKEEYEKQGREETERALKHLRQQMLSSEISPWKTVSVLKEPKELVIWITFLFMPKFLIYDKRSLDVVCAPVRGIMH